MSFANCSSNSLPNNIYICKEVLFRYGHRIFCGYENGLIANMKSETDKYVKSEDLFIHPYGNIRKGSVIVNNLTSEIGVVSNVTEECVAMAVRRMADGELCAEEIVAHIKDCRPATWKEQRALQHLLNERKLLWDMRHYRLKKNTYVPQNGARVQLSTLGGEVIIGVFKEIDSEGRIVMYCMMRPGERPVYSMREVAGVACDFQIKPVGSTARMKLDRALAAEGVVWNGHLRCMEMIGTRLLREQVYYYLDEFFEICEVQDAYKPRDRKRMAAGNYFSTREAAENMRKCFVAILRMQHSAEAEGKRNAKIDTNGCRKKR